MEGFIAVLIWLLGFIISLFAWRVFAGPPKQEEAAHVLMPLIWPVMLVLCSIILPFMGLTWLVWKAADKIREKIRG